MVTTLSELEDHLKQFVQDQDKLHEGRLKIWIMTAVIMQVVPLITIAFFLGGIYQNLNGSLRQISAQQVQLARNEQWMRQRERWELSVEIWAKQVKPPLQIDKPSERN